MQYIKFKNTLIINLSGDIDHHIVNALKLETEQKSRVLGCKNIIYNFSDVEFMDSSGIGMLLGRYKAVKAMGGNIAACCVGPNLSKIFKISGITKIIEIFSDIESAKLALEVH